MARELPARGSFVVGYAHNQLFGSTEEPPQDNGEIIRHLFFAHSYTKDEALHYAQQGFTVFRVEPGLQLLMVDLCPEVPKRLPLDIPSESSSLFSFSPQFKPLPNYQPKRIPRTESVYGCNRCSVRYLKVGVNATTCPVCKVNLRCNSCGHCYCESLND